MPCSDCNCNWEINSLRHAIEELKRRRTFLFTGVISRTSYDGETEKFPTMKIVVADSEEEAIKHFHDYWDKKNSSYSVSYYVENYDVVEEI